MAIRAYRAMALWHLNRREQAEAGFAALAADLGRDPAPAFENLQLLDRVGRLMAEP